MLLSVSGASGVGKSTVLEALQRSGELGPGVTCVEFDSIGVPDGADTAWRHGATEEWVRFAIEQDAGRHVLLAGQVPPGELLAAPSADRLDGIAVCVLHSSPEVQEARLVGRGERADSLCSITSDSAPGSARTHAIRSTLQRWCASKPRRRWSGKGGST